MTLVTPSIKDLFEAADTLVVARVVDSESLGDCGTRYTATLLMTFKGKPATADKEAIKFGRWNTLETGTDYLLFLSYVADPRAFLERIPADERAKHPEQEILEALACHGLVPGYEFDPSIVGYFDHQDFVLPTTAGYLGAPNDLPQPVTRIDILEYVTTRSGLFAYLERLSRP